MEKKEQELHDKSQEKQEQEAPETKEIKEEPQEKKKDEKEENQKILALFKKMKDEDRIALFKKAKSADSYLELLQRTRADYENYQKREERNKADFYKYANQNLLTKLVKISDSFVRAIDSASQHNIDQSFIDGIQLVEKEFEKVLKDFGVQVIEAMEKTFNPKYHEAISQQVNEKYPEMTIIYEVEKGYMLHDRLLRASKVIVSRQPEKKTEEKEEKESKE